MADMIFIFSPCLWSVIPPPHDKNKTHLHPSPKSHKQLQARSNSIMQLLENNIQDQTQIYLDNEL